VNVRQQNRTAERITRTLQNLGGELGDAAVLADLPELENGLFSEARLAANRANSRLSTGPKTKEGKAASSQNSVRHGLAASFAILPWENGDEFYKLLEDLRSEHKPATPTEHLLVKDMAKYYWLIQRSLILQTRCLENESEEDLARLSVYIRYQATHQRAFHRALSDFLKLRREQARQQQELQSQPAVEIISVAAPKTAAAAVSQDPHARTSEFPEPSVHADRRETRRPSLRDERSAVSPLSPETLRR
jgi:hypothetical protein